MKRTPYALTFAPNFKWAPLAVEGASGKAWIKILGKDQESGATAALVKYDTGFSRRETVTSSFSDSIVVQGNMTWGDRKCRRLSYFYRPTGTKSEPMTVEEETIRFVITGGKGEEASDVPVFIENVEAETPPWEPSERSSAWSEKTLRIDEKANCLITYQFATMFTMFRTGQKWVHPAVEEAYCIEGAGWDYVGEVETFVKLLPGTYIYRPPNETFHGTATTFEVPRRIFVKYYDADFSKKFARSIEEEVLPATLNE